MAERRKLAPQVSRGTINPLRYISFRIDLLSHTPVHINIESANSAVRIDNLVDGTAMVVKICPLPLVGSGHNGHALFDQIAQPDVEQTVFCARPDAAAISVILEIEHIAAPTRTRNEAMIMVVPEAERI